MKLTTYTARYADYGDPPIYVNEPCGNLIGHLPLGTWPIADPASTLERVDGGDPWEHAVFQTPAGRRVIITRDAQPQELRIVVVCDSSGNDNCKVYSNCKTLPVVILDKGSRDPDNTDAAEARLVAEELTLIDESLN